jgi:hypothetical protein
MRGSPDPVLYQTTEDKLEAVSLTTLMKESIKEHNGYQ